MSEPLTQVFDISVFFFLYKCSTRGIGTVALTDNEAYREGMQEWPQSCHANSKYIFFLSSVYLASIHGRSSNGSQLN